VIEMSERKRGALVSFASSMRDDEIRHVIAHNRRHSQIKLTFFTKLLYPSTQSPRIQSPSICNDFNLLFCDLINAFGQLNEEADFVA